MIIENNANASGVAHIVVNDKDGNLVKDYGLVKNLILIGGLVQRGDISLGASFRSASVPSPNKELLAGTLSQVGNVVTSSGEVNFSDPIFNVGDSIKFASGRRALITSILSNTSVEVFEDQTINNEIATIYYSGRGASTLTSSSLNGQPYQEVIVATVNFTRTSDTFNTSGTRDINFTLLSPEFTSSHSISSITNNNSRIFLDPPLEVSAGNTITVNYNVRVQFNNAPESFLNESPIAGLPLEWNCSSIVADGSQITVNTELEHYYIVGDEVKIENAIPTDQPVDITSNGTTWTLVSNAHGYVAGDTITIAGTSNYDGDHTVDSVIDANSFTIANTINSTAQGGTVRFTTPANYFNDSFVVASVLDDFTVILNSTLQANTPVADNGALSSLNSACKLNYWGNWNLGVGTSGFDQTFLRVSDQDLITDPLSYGEFTNLTNIFSSLIPRNPIIGGTNPSLINGFTQSYNYESETSEANHHERIKQLVFESDLDAVWMLTFDHVQAKPNTFDLDIVTSVRYLQDLT